MSFRDNLLHLRASKNMTQEQLALLLGVSRQSVTKWEAEKSYPEMDKLLKMCQIFNCTLDELVQGDLSSRSCDAKSCSFAAAPRADVLDYDKHRRKFAGLIATGVSLIVLGCGLGTLAGKIFTPFLSHNAQNISEGIVSAIILGFFAVALCLLIPASIDHSAFMKAHPYLEDFYTQANKDKARHKLILALVVGTSIIFIGLIVEAFGEKTRGEDFSDGIFLIIVAAGLWIIMRETLRYRGMNLKAYNKESFEKAETLDIADLDNTVLNNESKERLVATHKRKRRRQKLIGAICGALMLVATIVALCWMFVDLNAIHALGSEAKNLDHKMMKFSLFWLPWPLGGILCGLATILINAFYPDNANKVD